jgi:hypothetical protein
LAVAQLGGQGLVVDASARVGDGGEEAGLEADVGDPGRLVAQDVVQQPLPLILLGL